MASLGTLPATQSPTQRFFSYYQLEATALLQQMARIETLPNIGGERLDAMDHCLGGISRLQMEVQDAASYTTSYDQRMYSEGIKALNEKLEKLRATLAPKSKFSFKNKKNSSAISLSDAAELARQQQPRLLKPAPNQLSSDSSSAAPTPGSVTPRRGSLGSFLKAAGIEPTKHAGWRSAVVDDTPSNSVNISLQEGVVMRPPSSAAHATSSGSVTELNGCVIDMSMTASAGNPFAGLTIKDVQQSLLICGTINGAVHITGVQDSVILITTRQFRMHECKNCVIYMHVSSKPIIEDCKGVRFAPLPKAYSAEIVDNEIATVNQWNQIQDFKWLKAEQSPNWSILPEADIISDETWQRIAQVGVNLPVDDILKASGVRCLRQ